MKRCAHCGALNPRRSVSPSSDWANYLRSERNATAVGTLVIPLCNDCYSDARDLSDEVEGDAETFLEALDTSALVDQVNG